jgi:hypothetical protein
VRPIALVLLVLVGCYKPSECSKTGTCPVEPPDDGAGDGSVAGCFEDNFNTQVEGGKWTSESSTGAIKVELQELRLELPASVTPGTALLASKETIDLTDSEIRIEFVQPPAALQATATFRLRAGAELYAIEYANRMLGSRRTDTTQTVFTAVGFDPSKHRYLRFIHSNSRVVLEASGDQLMWSELSNFEATVPVTGLTVEIELKAGVTSEIAIAQFDNLELFRMPDCLPSPTPVITRDGFESEVTQPLEAHAGEFGAMWTIARGVTMQAIVSGGTVSHNNLNDDLVTFIASGTPLTADYDVEADLIIRSFTNGNVGLTTRSNDIATGNHYLFNISTQAATPNVATPSLFRTVEGNGQLLIGCPTIPVVVNQVYRLRLRVRDDEVTAWIDGRMVCNTTDDALTLVGVAGLLFEGAVGGATGMRLDNFLATDATH